MSDRRRGGALLGLAALLVSLALLSARAQEQPPELDGLHNRGLQLYRAGKFAEALPIVEEYIAVAAAKFGEQHPLYATGLGYLGDLYQALNQPSEAEPLFKRALLIKEKTLGPDHAEVADALHDLAEFFRKYGRFAEAEPLYQRTLAIAEKELGPDHRSIPIVLGQIAELYRAQGRDADADRLDKLALSMREATRLHVQVVQLREAGRYSEALPLAERHVEVLKESHGAEHSFVASALNELAILLERGFGRYEDSERLKRQALAIDEKSLGPNHADVARDLNNLAELLRITNRLAEAEPLFKRAISIKEEALGPEHVDTAASLNNLGLLFQAQGRYTEAEPLLKRALQIKEQVLAPEHLDIALGMNNLALLYQAQGRYADAQPLLKRALEIKEHALPPNHPDIALGMNNLAGLYKEQGQYAEAEPLLKRALQIQEHALPRGHPDIGHGLNELAGLYYIQGRFGEAEPFMRRALAMDEKSFGPDHPTIAVRLNNLAVLLEQVFGRYEEAEKLKRRALTIDENSFGPDHTNVAFRLHSLAASLHAANRVLEAESLLRRALTIDERNLGADHPNVAKHLISLATMLKATNRFGEADSLIRRALAINERTFGPDHPDVATSLGALAELLWITNRAAEAEPLLRRALTISEKSLGPHHPGVARILNNLASLRAELGDWPEAVALHRRAKPILVARNDREGPDRAGLAKGILIQNTWAFRAHARAWYRAEPESPSARDESFELAQWALQTGAADALAQMSVRFAKGVGPLAVLVRERQDLLARRQGDVRRLDAAAGLADVKAAEEARAAVAELDKQLDIADTRLASEFRDYSELASPKPLSIAAAQGLLTPNEVLVLFLDVPQFASLPEETLVWVVTREQARWRSISLGTRALSERVAALRCGLDRDGQWIWEPNRARWLARESICAHLRGDGLAADEQLPFSLSIAYELYAALFGAIKDDIKGKQVFVVPSGPLTQLPFHVLVTEKPAAALGTNLLRRAAWLAKSNAITVLPAVSSLKALREHARTSHATKALVGFGNPLLLGPSGTDRRAWEKQSCPKTLQQRVTRVVAGGVTSPRHRNGLADVAHVRAQIPLPETADELCAVARDLRVPESDILLGARATERNIKAMSEDGSLAKYRFLHFATHGALAREAQETLGSGAEPGLILTPPDEATPEDDGYLSASEIAGLKLDADWVILSACNTGAGGAEGAEALSGLARAFFYAGARAVLVSHWAVDSDITVKLIKTSIKTMATDKSVGRTNALRQSMLALIEKGETHEAHPAYWGPFVVVGEGGAELSAETTPSIVQDPKKQPPANAKFRTTKKTMPTDWRKEIWRQ